MKFILLGMTVSQPRSTEPLASEVSQSPCRPLPSLLNGHHMNMEGRKRVIAEYGYASGGDEEFTRRSRSPSQNLEMASHFLLEKLSRARAATRLLLEKTVWQTREPLYSIISDVISAKFQMHVNSHR